MSNHDQWRALPVVGHHADDTYLFLDHRTPLAEQAAAIRSAAIGDAVDEIVRVVLEPAAYVDCDSGVHDWRAIDNGRIDTTARCRACGDIERLDAAALAR